MNQKKIDRIPVERGAEEQLLQSVVKEKPIIFPDQKEISEKDYMDNEISRIESKSTTSKVSRVTKPPEQEDIDRMLARPVNLNS